MTGFDFDLNDFLARNGETEQLAFKGWVEQVYNCIWDSDHRNKLQDSLEGCGIIPPEADPIGDFRRIRNDLIHKHGLASTKNSGKCKVLTWFKPGEPIILGMRHVFDFLNQMGMMSSSPAYPPDQILMGTANKATGSYSRMKKVLYYHEGLLDYCLVQDKYTDPNDPRKIGWSLGRQIICQHMIEIALKTELAKHGKAVPSTHDFKSIFKSLPARRQKKAETTYRQILRDQVRETFDVFETVESFFHFLGKRPTVETRYYWEKGSQSNQLGLDYFSNLITPDNYVRLAYALMIAFHNYPTEPLVERYDTKFISLRASLEADRERNIRVKKQDG